MQGGAIARRYARAVFEIAREGGELDHWRSDLAVIAAALRQPAMEQVAENPKISFAQKQALVRNVLKDVNPLALNLVYLLIEKDRLDSVQPLVAEYEALYNQARGIEIAEVTTAVPLSPAEEQALALRLGGMTGKQIVLRVRVDPAIIGGMIARIGDRVIDGSVRARLVALKQRLVAAGTI